MTDNYLTDDTRKRKLIYLLLVVAPLAFIFVSLFLGRYPISIPDVIYILWCKISRNPCSLPDICQTLVWDIRLPRAILGALVGGCLSISGAAFQGIFRNPLVSPDILGVSSGASFGAGLAILLIGTSTLAVSFFAFVGGLAAVSGIGRRGGRCGGDGRRANIHRDPAVPRFLCSAGGVVARQ